MHSHSESNNITLKELCIKLLTLNYKTIRSVIKRDFRVKAREKILDFGCGTGILSPLFDSHSYLGVDIDKSLIEYAKKKHKNYTFVPMRSGKLNFPNNFFDKILIAGVLHHLDKKTSYRTLKELKRILKKDGTILAIEAIPPLSQFNILGKFLRSHDEGHHIMSTKEYKKQLSPWFKVSKTYERSGGILDYGVLILKN